jgi:hypothetical protein
MEGLWVVVQAVNGSVLADDGFSEVRRWTGGVSGVFAIGGDLRFGSRSGFFAMLAIEAALFGAALGTF